MTLRGRLTTAFLAVVLGPVLLGALFVGVTVSAVSRERTAERLDHAADTARTAVAALCRQLQAVADAVAVLPEPSRAAAADQLVTRGVASGVQVADPAGRALFSTPGLVPDGGSWRECAAPRADGAGSTALVAAAETLDGDGAPAGAVYAVQLIDEGFMDRLAGATGTAVTLLAGAGVARSTEPPDAWPHLVAPADSTGDGRYVRRLAPVSGQPLPLVLSVPAREPIRLYALLVVAVLLVAIATVVAASWLARSTTRPLVQLAGAVDRVAAGELDTRVPVLRQDELGRLGSAFNRMTRELQSYVQALTASRDQLRGHLTILGETLSSTHDLHRILRVILQTALSATGARGGAVLLTDPVDGVLVAHGAEGLPGRWSLPDGDLAALRVPLGEGMLGAVAASGEPRRGVTGRDLRPSGPDEPPCRSYVAVPICAPAVPGDPLLAPRLAGDPAASDPAPTTLGVLALYDRLGADEFDDADLVILRTFARQAGVAVNNVRVHEEAQRLSLTDPLTGLWNYRHLRECVGREVERASRFGRMLTVLALDLDHFKDVNDTYGHAAGDTVLHEFARRIRVGLREVDLAFRQGGEEFVVLLPETDAYGGIIVAERLGAAVRDIPVPIDPRRLNAATGAAVDHIPVSVSIGIAVYPEHGGTAQQVLDAADDALYAAKAAGRDTYRLAVSTPRSAGQDNAVKSAGDPASGSGGTTIPTGPAGASASASGGPHPPRQSRGR